MPPGDCRGRRRLLAGAALGLLGAGMASRGSAASNPAVPILVLADGGTRLVALDPADLRPGRTLALPGGPWQRLLASADAAALLVADDGSVACVAPDASALLALRPGDGPLTDAALGDGGRQLLLASRAPGRLTLLDATTLQLLKRWPLATADGRSGAAGAEVHDAPVRRSFVVAPADLPEWWEISYDPHAEDQYEGLVHDFRMGEGVPVRGYLNARRTRLPQPLGDLALDARGLLVVGAAPGRPLQGYNLDTRRRAGEWRLEGEPRPRAGVWLQRDGSLWLALPDARRPLVHWLHPDGGTASGPALPAPARWLRAGPAGPVLWAATGDRLVRLDVDSGTLEPVDVPGTPLDLALLPGGREALLLTGGPDAALHRVDLVRGASTRRQGLSQPIAFAPGGPVARGA